ncbi:MAG: S-layer homology domain-containing protein [Oscillospiraceae bacterium]|jgi:hypothetical protein|nr:S-layer homology domain-containing protein [Oscillospiraceae bacterium]
MKRRLLPLLLTLLLLSTSLLQVQAATQADLQTKLDALVEQYVGTCWYGSYDGAIQCKGFADLVYNALFGTGGIGSYVDGEYYYIKTPRNSVLLGEATGYSASDGARMYAIFSQAKPGDYVQMARRNRSYGHSVIIYSVETDRESGGVWVFDCNMSYTTCLVQKYFMSWEKLADISTGITLYRHDTYPTCDHDWQSLSRTEPTETVDGKELLRCAICGIDSESVIPCALSETMAGFADVDANAWYYPYLRQAVQEGLLNGISDTAFAPNAPVTRGMAVTILWRMYAKPAGGAQNFADVAGNCWYSQSVAWAAANGIVNGVTSTRFAPDDNVQRQQLAVMLYRCAKYSGLPAQERADLSAYADARSVSPYAEDAMRWAVAVGLMNGRSGNVLAPSDTATRAEAAKLILRFASLSAAQATAKHSEMLPK